MRSAAATARTRAPHARTLAPRPRRVSGPIARRVPTRPVAVPRTRVLTGQRALDRLLRGRAWIWLIGGALMGIVAMQVSLLKLNTGISRAVQTISTYERLNADLEKSIAKAASSERIARIAGARGMIAPSAGTVEYLRARPESDAVRAVKRMGPPTDEARQLAAAPATTTQTTTAAATTTTVAPVTETDPAAGVAAAAATPGQG